MNRRERGSNVSTVGKDKGSSLGTWLWSQQSGRVAEFSSQGRNGGERQTIFFVWTQDRRTIETKTLVFLPGNRQLNPSFFFKRLKTEEYKGQEINMAWICDCYSNSKRWRGEEYTGINSQKDVFHAFVYIILYTLKTDNVLHCKKDVNITISCKCTITAITWCTLYIYSVCLFT